MAEDPADIGASPDLAPASDMAPAPDFEFDLGACDLMPVLIEGAPSGYESCGERHFDRADDVVCPPQVEGVDFRPCASTGGSNRCDADTDCGAGQRCLEGDYICECYTLCQTDAECADGEACRCPRPNAGAFINQISMCAPAECRDAADCEDGFGCGLEVDACGIGRRFYCRTPRDTCRTDADCDARAAAAATDEDPAPQLECQYIRHEDRFRCAGPADCD